MTPQLKSTGFECCAKTHTCVGSQEGVFFSVSESVSLAQTEVPQNSGSAHLSIPYVHRSV